MVADVVVLQRPVTRQSVSRLLTMVNTLTLVLTCAMVSFIPQALRAQSQCRAADSTSLGRIVALTKMMTSSDSRWVATRNAYALPVVPDTAIAVLTDSAVCARAAAAYNGALPTGAQISGRNVYVVRVGATRYVVWDRASVDGLDDEYTAVIVFDASFVVLGSFAS